MSNRMTRREVLRQGAAAAAGITGGLWACVRRAEAAAARRPNILFIMVDEMRWDAMGCEDHPVCRTPNLDRLARQGVRFANSYTVAPVCSPARACAFSGRYAQVNGVTSNDTPANEGEIFLPSVLKHYGYNTAVSGKLHYVPKHDPFDFDEFWSYRNEGLYADRTYPAYLDRKYGSRATNPKKEGTCPWPDDALGQDVGLFAYPKEDFETEWIADRAMEYLQGQRGAQQPWFLFTSFLRPHSPFIEPEPYFSMYDRASLRVPPIPPGIVELRAKLPGLGKRVFIADEDMLRAISAIYYASITHVDEQVGRLLKALEDLGMADDTIVLFTADHGNMLGDRGRMFKGVMYEGSSHIPLLMRAPRRTGGAFNTGRVVEEVVEITDIMPTLLEMCGIPIPSGVQGRSFLGVAEGKAHDWKDIAFAQLGTAMVRTPEYKLIETGKGANVRWELYDMKNDPKEERDLAGEPSKKTAIRELAEKLQAWRAEKPAPIRIAGMSTPSYAHLSEEERKKLQEKRRAKRRRRAEWKSPSQRMPDK